MLYQTKKDEQARYIGGVLDGPIADGQRYATVVLDPPWPITMASSWDSQKKELDYPTMTLEQIAGLPLRDVLADDAYVFLWTTSAMLPTAFPLLAQWGLRYRWTFTWTKSGGNQRKDGPQHNVEFIVCGSVGKPQFISTKMFFAGNRDAWADGWERQKRIGGGKHSVKPDGWYEMLVRTTPEPRLDVFSRREIPGFDCAGDIVTSKILNA